LTFRTRKPIAFDAFSEIAPTGRFVIVDGFDIAGGGIIPAGDHVRSSAGGDHRADILSAGSKVTRRHRVRRNGHPGCVLWLTGPPGAGKSTIAAELERELFNMGRSAYVLDGDNVHGGLCSDLSFTVHDRHEQMRRVGEVAKLFDDAGVICIAALISPRRDERDGVRRLLPEGSFVEVHLTASPEILEKRSGNGRFAKTRLFAYEPPENPELEIRTDDLNVSEAVHRILVHLKLARAEEDFSI
jgi:bifunctional enzyme CysN/CysC